MLFISHSVTDKPVIDDFFDLLQTGPDVHLDEAFISSVSGIGIPSGEKFVDEILNALREASLVVVFVTPNYLASRFCLAELGGAWALGKPIFPLVGPNVNREIGANMLGTQTERIDTAGLNRLFDRLKEILPPRKWDTDRWEFTRDRFLEKFAEKYPTLPQPDVIDRATLEKEQTRVATTTKLLSEREEEIRQLKQLVQLLENAKDANDVREIRLSLGDERDQYEELVNDVANCLQKHEITVVRCIYATFTRTSWYPTQEAWATWHAEIERMIGSQRMKADDKTNPTELWANGDHPQLRPTFAALQALAKFLGEHISASLSEQLEQELEIPINMKNREYWETVLLGDTRLPD